MSENVPVNVRRIGIKLLAFVLLVGIVWHARPLFHPFLYRVAYSPGGLYMLGLPTLAGLLLFFAPPLRSSNYDNSVYNKCVLFGGVIVLGFVLTITLGLYGSMLEDRTLAQETMDDAVELDEFPEVNAENPRIAPRAVADVQTRGSVSYRTHRLGASDIARMDDGRLAWSYPIQPDQFNNRLNDHQRGVLLSDMTAMEDREMVAYDEQEFHYGEGQFLHRSTGWNLLKSDYGSQYNDDPIEFVHDGEAYMAFPKTGHEWHWTPVPHTTPTWDGVALVHQDGTIEHLSPEEAQESEILSGQRLMPLDVSKDKIESLKYREGIRNTLPWIGSFENVIEPAAMPSGADNSQPFVIDLAGEQMTYVYAMEPPGSDTRGLDEVWFVDAATGEASYYGTGSDTLLGPERASGIVRAEDTRTDWDYGETAGQFRVVEPVPVTVDEELWWHMKVAPTDNTDVTRNVFVNAHSGEAVAMFSTEAVKEFLRGTDAEEVGVEVGEGAEGGVDVEPAPEDVDFDLYLVVYDENGEEVDRIPLEPEYDISIDAEEAETDEGG